MASQAESKRRASMANARTQADSCFQAALRQNSSHFKSISAAHLRAESRAGREDCIESQETVNSRCESVGSRPTALLNSNLCSDQQRCESGISAKTAQGKPGDSRPQREPGGRRRAPPRRSSRRRQGTEGETCQLFFCLCQLTMLRPRGTASHTVDKRLPCGHSAKYAVSVSSAAHLPAQVA